jgi:FlaA1/EpsC-like NDP-sugar epimerase
MILNMIANKTVLVTGGTGSIGSEIVRRLRLLPMKPKVIRVFANSENELFSLNEELGDWGIRYLIGDICSKERLVRAMKGVDVVFHAAAMKHVPICEYNPLEAINVDVIGTANVFKAAIKSHVKYLVNISTDKAVNPICTMGACKLLGERIITTAREYVPGLIAYNVRFGNVLGSRGSIVPKVRDYLLSGKQIGVTDERMTRFIMTIPAAVNLILESLLYAQGSETFILKMGRARIVDLIHATAEWVIEKHHLPQSLMDDALSGAPGRRPGEKLSESLLTAEEADVALETDDMIIIPAPTTMEGRSYVPSDMLNTRPLSKKRYESGDGPFLSEESIRDLLVQVDL